MRIIKCRKREENIIKKVTSHDIKNNIEILFRFAEQINQLILENKYQKQIDLKINIANLIFARNNYLIT